MVLSDHWLLVSVYDSYDPLGIGLYLISDLSEMRGTSAG